MTSPTRADKYTSLSRSDGIKYSDFLDSFQVHPLTRSLGMATDEASIKQALRNLIMTDAGERFFQPNFGSNIRKSLFDQYDDRFAQENVIRTITSAVDQLEGRVNLLGVTLGSSPDNNSFNVSIVFSIINSQVPTSLSLLIKRVR